MYQRIVVPVDTSATSRAALEEVKRFANEQHAKVRIVHVIDLAQFAWSANEFLDVPQLQETLRDSARRVLTDGTEALRQVGIEPEAVLLETWGGLLAKAIVEDAAKWGADLVVMGTHGYGGLTHMLLGSVAEGVVRHAHIPVLLVHAKPETE